MSRPLANLNLGKRYPDQIKPFNFLLSCHVAQLGHPVGADSAKFHLVGRYETDARKWLATKWIEQYSGKKYRITTTSLPSRNTARVKTYGDIATEYEFHPESKCAGADGKPCGKQTVGLLHRRHIRVDQIKYIGKESNNLEEVDLGLIHSAENVYTEYPDPRRDEWTTKILPALRQAPLKRLVRECKGKLSRRTLIDLRAGRSRPHPSNQVILTVIVKKLTKANARPGKEIQPCPTKTQKTSGAGKESTANNETHEGESSASPQRSSSIPLQISKPRAAGQRLSAWP